MNSKQCFLRLLRIHNTSRLVFLQVTTIQSFLFPYVNSKLPIFPASSAYYIFSQSSHLELKRDFENRIHWLKTPSTWQLFPFTHFHMPQICIYLFEQKLLRRSLFSKFYFSSPKSFCQRRNLICFQPEYAIYFILSVNFLLLGKNYITKIFFKAINFL